MSNDSERDDEALDQELDCGADESSEMGVSRAD